jgi:cytochrome c-type biogenesis protein CcmE
VDTVQEQTARTGRGRWVAGVTLIVTAIAGLAVWAMFSPGALAYYKSPAQVAEMDTAARAQAKLLRIGGRVVELDRTGRTVFLTLSDGKAQVPVEFTGEVPDTLKLDTDAIVEGDSWTTDGVFAADRVQAKCSSKFVPKDRPGDLGKT